MKNTSIISSIFWSLVSTVFSKGSVILISLLAAHSLSESGFAIINIVFITVSMFSSVIGMGLGVAATKYTAQDIEINSKQLSEVLSLLFFCAAFLSFISALLVFFWIYVSIFKGSIFLGVIVSILIVANIFNGLLAGVMQGAHAFKAMARINIIQGGGFVGGGVISYLIKSNEAFVVAFCVSQLVSVLAISFVLKPELKRHGVFLVFDRNMFVNLAPVTQIAIPSLISGLVFAPVNWVIVAVFSGMNLLYDVSAFSIANQWRFSIMVIPVVIGTALLPFLSRRSSSSIPVDRLNFDLSYFAVFVVVLPFVAVPEILAYPFGSRYSTPVVQSCIQFMLLSAMVAGFKIAISRKFITHEMGRISVLSNFSWLIVFAGFFLFYEKNAEGVCRMFFYSQVFHLMMWMPYYMKRGVIEPSFFGRHFYASILLTVVCSLTYIFSLSIWLRIGLVTAVYVVIAVQLYPFIMEFLRARRVVRG